MAGTTGDVPPAVLKGGPKALSPNGSRAQAALEEELDRLKDEAIAIPADLEARARTYLDEHPAETWDDRGPKRQPQGRGFAASSFERFNPLKKKAPKAGPRCANR
jgi:hypothetical protein